MKKYKDEECPKCGNYVRGQFAPSGSREFFTKGIKTAALAAADNQVPYLGTGIDLVLGKHIDGLFDGIADELDGSEEFIFECPKCGNKWVSSGRPQMPEELILQIRDSYVEDLRHKRPIISSVIWSALAIYCLVFMFIGVAEEDGVRIAVAFFMSIPFIIVAVVKLNKIRSINREISECESIPLQEFKMKYRALFRKYPQYS